MIFSDLVILVVSGILGAMIGSFLNVVIHRMPERRSIVWPGSHCPSCGAAIRAYDNLPILSWLILRGRCRSCRASISIRYPFVEALTAVLTVVVAWRFLVDGGDREWARFFVAEAFTAALVAVTFIDLEHTIIPDRITKPGMVAAPLLSMLVPEMHRTEWLDGLKPSIAALILSLAGMAVGALSIWLIGRLGTVLFRKRLEKANVEEAMGFGDVKFMGVLGGFLGPLGVLLAFLIACLLGSVVGVISWIATRSMLIPFGPFLSAGGFTVLLWYQEVVYFLTETYPSLFTGG